MRLYSISDEYVELLRKKYPRIYSNKEDTRIHTRKYLGVVLEIDGYKFYIPLSSPKKHDYKDVDGKKTIRKDSLIVIRMISYKNWEKDKQYRDLITEELIFIRKHKDKIKKSARVLYSKKKASNSDNAVVANCLDFIAVCSECDKWIAEHGRWGDEWYYEKENIC